jgi:hypothetical protein
VLRDAIDAKGVLESGELDAALEMNYIKIVKAESGAEIAAALSFLQANEALCSREFAASFYAQSPLHTQHSEGLADGGNGFRCSFLVPPTPPPKPAWASLTVCANCGRAAEAGTKMSKCARCMGPAYCSRECQKADWSVHKQVCGKSADELRAVDQGHSTGSRPSVVFSLRPPEEMVGKFMATYSHNSERGPSVTASRTSGDIKPVSGSAPKNVHGNREFMVKVQPPNGGLMSNGPFGFASKELANAAGQPWVALIYDEHRSFMSHLPMDTPGIDALLRLVRLEGWKGIKGYFQAQREGDNLRIFADRIMPQPAW